jgi:hypothetical protein
MAADSGFMAGKGTARAGAERAIPGAKGRFSRMLRHAKRRILGVRSAP